MSRPKSSRIIIASCSLILFAAVLFSLVSFPGITASAQNASTANPNALPAAKKILQYFQQLPTRSDKRVIAGQFGSYGEGTDVKQAEDRLQKIFDQSGKWVALTGMDYHNWDKHHANNLSEPNRYLIEQWNKGSLVVLSWHAENPWTNGEATDCGGKNCAADGAKFPNVTELMTAGTKANANWISMMDDIATGLTELQDAGVIVIWRPFHEANGGWFWWQQQKVEDFRALWKYMFNYFTTQKHLNNLLWGYSPNVNNNQWNKSPAYYFPGDRLVDIVGLDKYMDVGEDPIKLDDWHEYTDLVALKKPIGLFEFGPSPAFSQPDRPVYDYARLIRDIKAKYPKIVFFQAWEWHWAIGEHSNAQGLMSDPWIISRDDLPKWDSPAQ